MGVSVTPYKSDTKGWVKKKGAKKIPLKMKKGKLSHSEVSLLVRSLDGSQKTPQEGVKLWPTLSWGKLVKW